MRSGHGVCRASGGGAAEGSPVLVGRPKNEDTAEIAKGFALKPSKCAVWSRQWRLRLLVAAFARGGTSQMPLSCASVISQEMLAW